MWVTCVGVTDDKSGGAFSNSLDEGPHLGGPQSAVQTDAGAHEGGVRDNCKNPLQEPVRLGDSPQRVGVGDADDKRLHRLTGQGPPAAVHNRPGNLHRQHKSRQVGRKTWTEELLGVLRWLLHGRTNMGFRWPFSSNRRSMANKAA